MSQFMGVENAGHYVDNFVSWYISIDYGTAERAHFGIVINTNIV
jgi:hypothetical protein